MLDVNNIRNDFPAFRSKEKNFIYLDSASTSQKPQSVIDSVSSYYSSYAANIHRALYEIGEKATDKYENVRGKVKQLMNVPDSHSVIFSRSTTESINLIAYAWGTKNLSQDDHILITEMEHHSNIVPWQLLASRSNAALDYISLKNDGMLELESFKKKISSKTKILSISHQSNVFGTVNPINEIIDEAKKVDAITVIDGAQAVPHMKVNIEDLGCDFYAFSGHKMLGPTGVGVLIGRKNILEEMDPFMGGGEMINTVNMDKSTWNDVPWKFEAGTPNIAQVIGLGAAIDFFNTIDNNHIEIQKDLTSYALNRLNEIDGITIYGDASERTSIISFNINNIHSLDIAQFLDYEGIAIRSGHHCCKPLMKTLGISSCVRISFHVYNTKDEIDTFIEKLNKSIKTLS